MATAGWTAGQAGPWTMFNNIDRAGNVNSFKYNEYDDKARLQGAQNASNERIAAMNNPLALFNAKWGAMQPYLGGLMGGGGGFQSFGKPAAPGAPITPEMQRDMLNNARAMNASSAETQKREFANSAAGKQFGGGSALARRLGGTADYARMMGDSQAGYEVPISVAKTNAPFLNQQFGIQAQMRNVDVDAANRRHSALLGLLGGIM